MARSNFVVVAVHVNGEMVLRMRGDIDIVSAPDFAFAAKAFTGSGMRVVLDFEEVTFMDSSGLNVIAVAGLELSSNGGSLSIRNASTNIVRTIEISGLAGYVKADSPPLSLAGAKEGTSAPCGDQAVSRPDPRRPSRARRQVGR